MVNTATVTGYTGPGALVTALVLNDVHSINYDFEKNMVYITYGKPYQTFKLAYNETVTITMTKSATGTATTIVNA